MTKTGIVYATNKDYLIVTLASMISLIENTSMDKENVRIYFMTENLEEKDYKLIEKIVKDYPNVMLSIHPIEDYSIEKYQIPGWQNTQASNARLFFQKILGENLNEVEEVLYLDSDTIVVDNLQELNQYDGKIYAALDSAQSTYLKQLGLTKYFNSGVLKINVDWWKKENCEEKIIKFAKENPNKKLTYPDQDILNCALENKIKKLPLNYNMPPSLNIMNGPTLNLYCRKLKQDIKEVEEAKSSPKILHSYGLLGIKPWTANVINPYNEIFREYIYKVDSNFELQELETMKKIVSINPRLFNCLFLLKSYTPDCLQGIAKQTALTFYKKK